MRKFSEDFLINGRPMLLPDEEVKMTFTDLDDGATGRDESGVMHRFVARYKVPTWEFSYSFLTEEERTYMEGIFPNEPTFTFAHPDGECTCYRSNYAITWKNAATGLWSGYGFTVICC